MTKKGNNLLIWKCHVTMVKKDGYIRNELQHQNLSLTFIHKNKSLLPTTSILSCVQVFYTTTASLDKLFCTNSGAFGKKQNRFGQFSRSRSHFNNLDVKLKSFQQRWQKRVPADPTYHNESCRFQPVYAIEESMGHCSRKHCWRGKLFASAATYNVQRHG